jgi:hypothetical protein
MSKAVNLEGLRRELDSRKPVIDKEQIKSEEKTQIGIITNCIFTIAQILEFFNY